MKDIAGFPGFEVEFTKEGQVFDENQVKELLDFLAQAPRTVDELAGVSGQSTANTSQHLQALHAAQRFHYSAANTGRAATH